MPSFTALLEHLDAADLDDGYQRLGLDRLSNQELVASVADCLRRPKVAEASSFVLHAPLELLARAVLLDRVPDEGQHAARLALVQLGVTYLAAGPELDDPVPMVGSVSELGSRLETAAAAGELDEVDRIMAGMAAVASAEELRHVVGPWVVASLAAAAHASIALHLLGRAGAASAVPLEVLRGSLRELARHPDWRLRWFEDPSDVAATPVDLGQALLDVPRLGVPGSSFIYPLMHQAEESGLAPTLLAGLALEPALPEATRSLQRVAAWSMLQEGPERAPYGWSHCLTMPQAVLSVAAHGAASAHAAVAVAATHVVGFRAALGRTRLDPAWAPSAPQASGLAEALEAGPVEAAAFAWAEVGRGGAAQLERALAGRASAHEDAHLVKYTLACIDARRSDPDAGQLYLAAAASLRGWWTQHDVMRQPM